MLRERFSKASVTAFIQRQIENIMEEVKADGMPLGFRAEAGCAQVEGKSESLNRCYGRYTAYLAVLAFMAANRVSKASLAGFLVREMQRLNKSAAEKGQRYFRYAMATKGFDPGNGYSQVEGKGDQLNRMYGQFRTYQDLMEWLELEWVGDPTAKPGEMYPPRQKRLS